MDLQRKRRNARLTKTVNIQRMIEVCLLDTTLSLYLAEFAQSHIHRICFYRFIAVPPPKVKRSDDFATVKAGRSTSPQPVKPTNNRNSTPKANQVCILHLQPF